MRELRRAHRGNRYVHIGYFLAWCAERGLRDAIGDHAARAGALPTALFHYRKTNGEPLTFRSQQRGLVPLRVWFRWLTRQNTCILTTRPRSWSCRAWIPAAEALLSTPEVEQVMRSPISTSRWACATGPSWKCSTRLGMRRSELMGLKLFDLDRERGR